MQNHSKRHVKTRQVNSDEGRVIQQFLERQMYRLQTSY